MNTPSLDGIVAKVEKHAELITILAGTYEHTMTYTPGGIQGMIGYLTADLKGQHGPLYEIKYDLLHPDWYFDKLLNSSHLYCATFKAGAALWLAGELGFLTKYKDLAKKVVIGSAIAAAINQGSSPSDNPRQSSNPPTPTQNLNMKIGGAF